MEYTLYDLLQEEFASGFQLLTSKRNFKQVIVSSVSVQELPVDNFIKKHELVLSTAVGCQEDKAMFMNLIYEVAKAQASALLLAFKKEDYKAPADIIDYANSLGLVLFSIPWECPFSNIQMITIRRIFEKKTSTYTTLQTSLFNSFFESETIDYAAKLISDAFQIPIVIKDSAYNILASSLSFSEKIDEPVEFGILLNDSVVGYLTASKDSALSKADADLGEDLIEKYICFPLSLWFNRRNIEDMVKIRLKNDYVWNLATQSYTSFSDMTEQGIRLHFKLSCSYTCMALKAIPQGAQQYVDEYSTSSAATTSKIESLLIQAGQKAKLSIMVGARNLDFIIFLENRSPQPKGRITEYINSIDGQLNAAFQNYRFYWGISETNFKKPIFHALYQNAKTALQYCLTSSKQQYHFTYQDSKEAQIIGLLSSNDSIQRIAKETIQPLQEYDASSDINLTGTLITYIKCNYNVSLTARELHIHRQSLLYRLEKIEALTDMALNNHQDIFLLEVCTRIYFEY